MATGNSNFGVDGLLATTIEHFVRKLEEQAFNKTVLLHILSQGGIPSQHGNKIVQPLLYGETSAKGSFSDTDVFSAPTRDGISAAEYDWKQYYASIMISGIEVGKNSGPEAVLSLLQARLRQAELSIAQDMNTMLFGDGTGNSGKDFDGLAAAIADDNTFGNIDRTDAGNTWWRAQEVDQGGALSLAKMRTAYNNVMDGVEKADHIITTQSGYEAYEALLEDTVRHESTALGDAGFDSLMFKSAPLVFDRDCTAETMYFLNTDYIELVQLDGKWFDVSDWLRPTNQDVQYKNILLYGNLTVSNSNRQGFLTGITNA
jgi:hypothetical protein